MAVSKDIEKGTWTSQVWVEDWQGKKKHKKKRGFATKKEALEWEHSILSAAKADMNMKLADFVDLYFRDKETELKARTVRNKRYMIEQHVVPMLGDKPMDGITPADIIQWQNYIRSKGFKETYQRMLQNQLTALFTHATKIYNLKDNPCAKVKRIGKADADKKQLQFWTLDEFNKFIIKLIPKRLYEVTFPEKIEKKALSPPEGSALPIESERGDISEAQGKHLEVTGHSLQGETNTKNILKITKETTCRDYPSINQGQEGQMDVIDTYTQIVKENIDYDILKADMKYRYDLLDELVDIIVDVVAVDREKIRIGGTDYPYQLVKGKFLKLESGHIRYVLDSMEKTTTHIANIRAYLLTALYNAPNTIHNYYSAEVNYYEYGDGKYDV